MKKILFGLLVSLLMMACNKKEDDSVMLPIKEQEPTPIVENDPPVFGTPFQNIPNLDNMIMYQVNQRAFSSTGDFKGITARLDSIKALGVNVIWLMPIHPIGSIKSVNSPYSVKNYRGINPEFGTMDDFRNLVSEAHKKNMAVIIDWVANHTSWDNDWIIYKSWYSQDATGNIIIPAGTNWQDVADLNFDNQTMRQAMIKAMKYWILAANIDGFRTDAADMVPYSFWKQAIDSLNKIPNRKLLFLAEGARADHFTAGFQLNFSWDFYAKLKEVFKSNRPASDLFLSHQNEYASIPKGKKKLRFTTNHDESAWDATPMVLFNGKEGSLAAHLATCYMGGVPLIYNSQEVGRTNTLPFFSKSPINWSENPDMLAVYKKIYAFYASSQALQTGDLATYPQKDVLCFRRTAGTEQVLVLVNVRNTSQTFLLPTDLANSTWQNVFENKSLILDKEISLKPYQYLVLQK